MNTRKKREILPGDVFNGRVIVREIEKNRFGQRCFITKCQKCGLKQKTRLLELKHGCYRCAMAAMRIAKPGEIYGDLIVLCKESRNGYKCRCSCGRIRTLEQPWIKKVCGPKHDRGIQWGNERITVPEAAKRSGLPLYMLKTRHQRGWTYPRLFEGAKVLPPELNGRAA